MGNSDCIFCKLASGEIPAQTVYEDDEILAFKDLNPVAPSHLLVIPKRHIAGLSAAEDGDGALLGRLQLAAGKIAAEQGLSDYRVVTNNGKGAGQSVFHLHYHLLAGRRFNWPPG